MRKKIPDVKMSNCHVQIIIGWQTILYVLYSPVWNQFCLYSWLFLLLRAPLSIPWPRELSQSNPLIMSVSPPTNWPSTLLLLHPLLKVPVLQLNRYPNHCYSYCCWKNRCQTAANTVTTTTTSTICTPVYRLRRHLHRARGCQYRCRWCYLL